MIKINIIENKEKSKNIKKVSSNVITKQNKNRTPKYKNIYKKLFIFLNLIIIYFILFRIYRKLILKNNYVKNDKINNNSFDNIYSKDAIKSIIANHIRTSIIWPLPKEIIYKPMMSDKDIKAFSYFMKPENIYFEFGSGGSTNLASYFKLKTYSVESDIKWHAKLKSSSIIANYITVSLNNTSFGYPGNNTNINDWKKYIQAYKKEFNADVILIDGRFRVACALDIFSKIKNNTMVLIHDYENRKHYHIIEKFYIKIKSWDILALFIKNPFIDSIPIDIYNFYLNEKAL